MSKKYMTFNDVFLFILIVHVLESIIHPIIAFLFSKIGE